MNVVCSVVGVVVAAFVVVIVVVVVVVAVMAVVRWAALAVSPLEREARAP